MKLAQVVGKRVRDLRTFQGLTQEGLAERAGLHYTHVQRLEQGSANPTLDTLESVALALRVPLPEILKSQDVLPPRLEALMGLLKDKSDLEIELVLELIKTVSGYVSRFQRDGGTL